MKRSDAFVFRSCAAERYIAEWLSAGDFIAHNYDLYNRDIAISIGDIFTGPNGVLIKYPYNYGHWTKMPISDCILKKKRENVFNHLSVVEQVKRFMNSPYDAAWLHERMSCTYFEEYCCWPVGVVQMKREQLTAQEAISGWYSIARRGLPILCSFSLTDPLPLLVEYPAKYKRWEAVPERYSHLNYKSLSCQQRWLWLLALFTNKKVARFLSMVKQRDPRLLLSFMKVFMDD